MIKLMRKFDTILKIDSIFLTDGVHKLFEKVHSNLFKNLKAKERKFNVKNSYEISRI